MKKHTLKHRRVVGPAPEPRGIQHEVNTVVLKGRRGNLRVNAGEQLNAYGTTSCILCRCSKQDPWLQAVGKPCPGAPRAMSRAGRVD